MHCRVRNINYSLTCLGDVIAALATNAKHIPFRNTKLTYLLQDSFGIPFSCLSRVHLSHAHVRSQVEAARP